MSALGRNQQIDKFRIIACISVVFIHVASYFYTNTNIENIQYILLPIVVDGFSKWAVDGFVMISGALFLSTRHVGKDLKYIIRLLSSYLIWGSLYSFYFQKTESVWMFINSILGGGCYHLWYLILIVSLYLLNPILRKVIVYRKLQLYMIVLAFSVGIIPSIILMFELFNFNYLSEGLYTGYSYSVFSSSLCYVGLYLCGDYLLNYLQVKKKSRGSIYPNNERKCNCKLEKMIDMLLPLAFFIICFITIVVTVKISISKGNLYYRLYDYIRPWIILESILLFVFFIRQDKRYCEKYIEEISNNTFCVYLIHPLVLDILFDMGINEIISCRVACLLIAGGLTFVLANILGMILRRIPLIRKIC